MVLQRGSLSSRTEAEDLITVEKILQNTKRNEGK